MTAPGVRPASITPFPNGEIGIVWEDGLEAFRTAHQVRCACACAHCVDELSGRKMLQDSSVPETIQATEIHPVGNYGVGIRWSDGHDTGIYTLEVLRRIYS